MIQDFLKSISSIEDSILEKYFSHCEEVQVPRNTIITQTGDIEKHFYFVLEGVQKSYYIHNDKEHIIAFIYPPSFSGVPDSFFNQAPSKVTLKTVTPSRFLKISYEKHQELMDKHRPIETLFRKAIEQILTGLLHRYYELMAFDMETRFKNFAQRSPHLFQMVPQKDIASYLKIDPTNFSKLLSKASF